MSFPVLKRIGCLSILLFLSGLFLLAAQDAAQEQAGPVKQDTNASASTKAAESTQSGTPTPVAAGQSSSAPADGQQPAASQTAKPAAPPATPQQGNSAPTQAMPGTVLKVTTRMVLVDVVVNDGSGRPVIDLKSDDFEIKENGKLQKISGFGLEKEAPAGTPIKPRVLPAGIYTNIPDFHPEAGPPTVLLIDALNTQVRDQPYLR